ncbi:MAG: HAMP domain-containing histidine kinase [Pseudomonadales bacterium]|nr:HAMP domain-containing histidine kinase [Pseudomonadales bacterium]
MSDNRPGRTGLFGTIASLVIVGFAATALPLIVALASGAIQVNALTRQGERTVVDSVGVARSTEFVADQLTSMERNARQYVVVGDQALLDLFTQKYTRLSEALGKLDRSEIARTHEDALDDIRKLIARVDDLLHASETDSDAIARAFVVLHRDASTLRAASDELIDRNMSKLAADSSSLQQSLVWQSVVLGVLGVALAVLFVRAILRPIRQIDHAIRQLGTEQFEETVHVEGPQDLQRIGERLDWLRLRLQEVDEAKNEFIRHMSHELKTPIASIREGASLLLDNAVGELDQRQHEVVSILDSGARRLHRLVENLLSFARWQSYREKNASAFDLSDLVTSQVKDHQLLLEKRGVNLELDCDPTIPVTADYERVSTLFANVLGNAIKYSPPGATVNVDVHARAGNVEIDVTDHGPGIPDSDRDRVFQPFYQGASGEEGTGIGLSLVRTCVELHGGEAVFMDASEGAHFHALLPIAGAQATGAQDATA